MMIKVKDVPEVWNNVTAHVGIFCNIYSSLRRPDRFMDRQ
jgi:hypothetical protein